MGFQNRLSKHDEIQKYLMELLDKSGYPCEPYGIESGRGLKLHSDLVKYGKNKAANYVRHQPDKIVLTKDEPIFVDIKTLTRYDTENFAIELDSYKTCYNLYENDCKVLIIFNTEPDPPYGLRACWIEQIKIHSELNLKPNSKRSGTPMGLIYKNEEYIKPISSFFFLKEDQPPQTPTQTQIVDFTNGGVS